MKSTFYITTPLAFLFILSVSIFLLGCKSTVRSNEINYKDFLNISYKEIPDSDISLTSLDIYTPEKGKKNPVMVFIHGGAWQIGDKSYHGNKAIAFTDKGYVFVSINYRLSPDVMHPSHVEDTASALAWIYKNIEDYGGDREKIYIMGHSAGASIGALVATSEKYLQKEGLDLNILKGVILLDGAGYNMEEVKELNEKFYSRIYEPAFGDDPEVLKDASPVLFISSDKGIPPFLIFYIEKRPLGSYSSKNLAEKLENCGIYAELVPIYDKTHGTLSKDIPGGKKSSSFLLLQTVMGDE